MSRRSQVKVLMVTGSALFSVACSTSIPVSPNPTATMLTVVSPVGGATSVDITSPVVLTFSGPMAQGMETYMDVHNGTTSDAVLPMNCTWSMDRTTLTCTHVAPFAHGATYTMHVGDGMTDATGNPVTMDAMINLMGGTWLQSGMMGGMHAGQPTSSMGIGWRGSNGSFGMMFTFTTS